MKRTALRILQGCLLTIAGGLLVLIVLVLSFRAAGAPEPDPRQADLQQPLPVSERQLAAEGLGVEGGVTTGMDVVMLLEEGEFTVEAGPPGSPIRVEGDYDAGVYDLKQEMVRGDRGRPEYRLSFRPRYSILGRILRQGFVHLEEGTNRLRIYLPSDRRIALRAKVSKGESTLDLGGLALESASLELRMGEHTVRASSPNAIEMGSLEVRGGMGEVHLEQLGNLRAERIAAWGHMGEFHVRMGRTVARDTKLYVRLKMGELTLGLPSGARIHASTSVALGGSNGAPDDEEADLPPGAPVVDVDAGVSLGELKYVKD